MRLVLKAAIGVLILLLPGCELKVRQATPPAPHPTVAQAEPPPSPPAPTEPLSTPQTQVRLPQPQPINPEAVVTPPVPPEPAQQRAKKRQRPGAPPASAAKPEPVETAEAPPQPESPPHRLEPVMPEDQRRQRLEEISARLNEVEQTLARVTAHGLNDAQKRTAEQIHNLKDQAYQARDQGDIQKATGLVDRVQLLVQDLARGH